MDKTVKRVINADDPCATNREYGANKNTADDGRTSEENDVSTAPPEPNRVGTVTEANRVIDTANIQGEKRLRKWTQDSVENWNKPTGP